MENIKRILQLKQKLASLPPLSSTEQAKLQNSFDAEHVYYSSNLEGSKLKKCQVQKVVRELSK